MQNNKVFCILPWIHMHTWPNGTVLPCCISSYDEPVGDLTTNTIAEVINSDSYKKIRVDMLNGVPVSSCKKCYEVEKYKGSSWRTSFNHDFQHAISDAIINTEPDGTITPNLLYVDFRFSNFCNLGCRTCGGDLSSTIASTPNRGFEEDVLQAYKAKGILDSAGVVSYSLVKPNFVNDDLKQYLHNTTCFYFAGGEPTIQKEHYSILTYLHENKWFDKSLRYSTNLSTLSYKGNNLMELWNDFENVWLMCSIDHMGDRLEYLRQGTNSQKLFQNLDKVIEQGRYKISISLVVSIYNVYCLYDFFEFLYNNNYINSLTSIEVLYAFGDQVSPAILPQKYKSELIDKLQKDLTTKLYEDLFEKFGSHFESSIKGMENWISTQVDDETIFDYFIKLTESFDKLYNKSIYKTFPWLGNCITDYKNHHEK